MPNPTSIAVKDALGATQTVSTLDALLATAGTLAAPATGINAIDKPRLASAAVTGVASSATSVSLLAARAARVGVEIANSDPSQILYVMKGATASIASGGYSAKLYPGDAYMFDDYTGAVSGIWDAAGTGYANITDT